MPRLIFISPYLKGGGGNAPHLFHYTSKTAKDFIVNGNSYNFQFTEADGFLDKNEGLHILEPYRHVCGKLYDQNKIDARFFNTLASIAFDQKNTDQLIPWVLCATGNGCSQYMKERYAPNDGYIIGFQALAFQDLWQAAECDIYQCEVTYSRKDIEQRITACLCCLHSKYVADSAQIQEKDFKLARAVRNILFQLSYCYKGEEFRQEEEIRLIIYPKAGFEEWTDDNLRLYMDKDDGRLHLNISGWYCYCVTDKLEKCNSRSLNKPVLSSDEIYANLKD